MPYFPPAVTATPLKVAVIRDEKAQGIKGGQFLTGAWRTRDLNTLYDPQSIGVTVSSNQFTLPAGTYHINSSAPAYTVNRHKTRLYNITDSTETLNGSNEFSTSGCSTFSVITGVFIITSTKTFELQHQCQTSSGGTEGFGEFSFGYVGTDNEIYSQIKVMKLA